MVPVLLEVLLFDKRDPILLPLELQLLLSIEGKVEFDELLRFYNENMGIDCYLFPTRFIA